MPKNALIIGAAGGIGIEVTKQFIEAGWSVVGTVRNSTERQLVLSTIAGLESVVDLDMGVAQDVRARLQALIEDGLSIDTVVVCTGTNPCGPLELADLDEARATLEINTLSCLAVYQATMPALRKTKGSLILISSMSGKVAMPFIGVYSASKHALEGLADVMRREAFPWAVKIVLIEPGGVNTQFGLGQIPIVTARRVNLSPDNNILYGDYFDEYIDRLNVNVPKSMSGGEVAQVVVQAAETDQPEARYIVGQDAVRLCEAARTKSDIQIDDFFRQSYIKGLSSRA